MTSVKELRLVGELHFRKRLSNRDAARMVNLGSATVSRILQEIHRTGKSWDELETISDEQFMALVRPRSAAQFREPDFALFYQKMRANPKLTMLYLYDHFYVNAPDDGSLKLYSYQRVCAKFKQWLLAHYGDGAAALMPFNPGEVEEIDFSGDEFPYRDKFGRVHSAHIFVASLRYSKMIYAEAMPNEAAASWLLGVRHSYEYFNGACRVLSIDNARSLVAKADKYVGFLTVALKVFARHYHVDVLTAKIKAPKYKQSVEYGCGEFQEKIQAVMLQDGPVYANDEAELNALLRPAVDAYNERPFTDKNLGSRRSLFDAYEAPALQPLPLLPFENYRWSCAAADKYHRVRHGGKRYMVQYWMAEKQVIAASGFSQLRFFAPGSAAEVGSYDLSAYPPQQTTCDKEEYMSDAEKSLRRGFNGMREIFRREGLLTAKIELFLKSIYEADSIPLVKYRRAMGFYTLCKDHGAALLDEVCCEMEAAGALQAEHYDELRELLFRKIDRINGAKNKRRAGSPRAKPASKSTHSNSNYLFYKNY